MVPRGYLTVSNTYRNRHQKKKTAIPLIFMSCTPIGFMMDCDTTGVEPDLALVKHKKMVGGGFIKIANHTTGDTASAKPFSEV